jgi:hypothetical protein
MGNDEDFRFQKDQKFLSNFKFKKPCRTSCVARRLEVELDKHGECSATRRRATKLQNKTLSRHKKIQKILSTSFDRMNEIIMIVVIPYWLISIQIPSCCCCCFFPSSLDQKLPFYVQPPHFLFERQVVVDQSSRTSWQRGSLGQQACLNSAVLLLLQAMGRRHRLLCFLRVAW